jgi:DNA-binding beta-propeller fold protein YncE
MMDGCVSDVYFNSPSGVAVDSEGNILIRVRYRNNNIRKINTTGFGSNLADNTSLTPCFSDGRGSDAYQRT